MFTGSEGSAASSSLDTFVVGMVALVLFGLGLYTGFVAFSFSFSMRRDRFVACVVCMVADVLGWRRGTGFGAGRMTFSSGSNFLAFMSALRS